MSNQQQKQNDYGDALNRIIEDVIVRQLTNDKGRIIVRESSPFVPSPLPPPWKQIEEFMNVFSEKRR